MNCGLIAQTNTVLGNLTLCLLEDQISSQRKHPDSH